MKSKFPRGSMAAKGLPTFSIQCEFLLNAHNGRNRINDALRTYATWLVRVTRRKMAASEPANTPKNEVELT
jgi:hypothetical protein